MELFLRPHVICEGELKEEMEDHLHSFLFAGEHGSLQYKTKHRMEKLQKEEKESLGRTRIRYLFFRIFPPRDHYILYEPECRKHPWLIPLFWVRRLCRGILKKRKQIEREIHLIWKKH